ncbi:hypothetical protein B0F90DRAFT_1380459 [Multifurca ochricompacta]|uniref:Uncharacterized protein n=1 Tax=Multifurca ochricompacta TaxID=376703 RepID=A0AAD4QPS5_9AGAM|nr:hypothetical protein B0F90DRAFT_1380459 [Multifurca ochricompacta]
MICLAGLSDTTDLEPPVHVLSFIFTCLLLLNGTMAPLRPYARTITGNAWNQTNMHIGVCLTSLALLSLARTTLLVEGTINLIPSHLVYGVLSGEHRPARRSRVNCLLISKRTCHLPNSFKNQAYTCAWRITSYRVSYYHHKNQNIIIYFTHLPSPSFMDPSCLLTNNLHAEHRIVEWMRASVGVPGVPGKRTFATARWCTALLSSRLRPL